MLRKYVALIKTKNNLLKTALGGDLSKTVLQERIWPELGMVENKLKDMFLPVVDTLLPLYEKIPTPALQKMSKTMLRLLSTSPYQELATTQAYAAQLTLNSKLATRIVLARGPYAAKVVESYLKQSARVFLICQETEKNCKAAAMLPSSQVIFVNKLSDRDECLKAMLHIKRLSHHRDIPLVDPGYDFHSESHQASEMCEKNGFQFAGPRSHALALAASKIDTKKMASQSGVPLIRGFQIKPDTLDQVINDFIALDSDVLIKGDNGGGGTANFKVNRNDIKNLIDFIAGKELLSKDRKHVVPGNMRYFIEMFLPEFSHIEIQGLIDKQGAYILEDRDCSVQRRNQKVLEIAPASHPAAAIIHEDARKILNNLRSKGYIGLLTLEFMVVKIDNSYRHHFIEINPRIQVEHTVTELLFGIDLPELKCRITAGETADSYFSEVLQRVGIDSTKLNPQEKINKLRELSPNRYAVEVRLNAHETYRTSGNSETIICGITGTVDKLRGDPSIYTNLTVGSYVSTIDGNSNTHLICAGASSFESAMQKVRDKLRSIEIDIPTNKVFLDNMLSHALHHPEFALNNQAVDKLDQLYPPPVKNDYHTTPGSLFRRNQIGAGIDTSAGWECKHRFGRINYHD